VSTTRARSEPAPGEPRRDVVLYDADCGFCLWCVAKVLAWDRRGRLQPMAIQNPAADRLLAGVPTAARLGSWHLASADGRVRSAGAAVAPLLRSLPAGRLPAALAAAAPWATERLYRLVADRRAVVGRLVTAGARERALRRIAARTPPGALATRGPNTTSDVQPRSGKGKA
jgi:predicted DCC family thiol-disulfide oxidoreductase YuxK